jgi:hypothetical protein
MQFSPASRHVFPLRSIYSPQCSVLGHHLSCYKAIIRDLKYL